MTKNNLLLLPFILLMLFSVSCREKHGIVHQKKWNDLKELPEDKGGEHLAFVGNDYPEAENGFYIYLPDGYEESPVMYPTLVFLHGSGERGDSMSDYNTLKLVLKNGPPKLIESGEWNPPVPFIVISPQTDGEEYWDGFTETFYSLLEEYPINPERIYLTGLSMGGYVSWGLMARMGEDLPIAACVPVCGALFGYDENPELFVNNISFFPIWAFHGEVDDMVPPEYTRTLISDVNAIRPRIPVKYTEFVNIGHSSWDYVYGSRFDTPVTKEFDPFDQDIYSWMLEYRRLP